MAPPDSAFQAQTRFTKSSRPSSRRPGCWRSISWRSTTIWVAMPAWSVPGCQSTSRPRMRSKRHRMSCSVLLSACPMCSEPVTFGGGMTMRVGLRVRRDPARPALKASRLLPTRGDARLDGGGVERLVHHGETSGLGAHGVRWLQTVLRLQTGTEPRSVNRSA